MHSSTAKIRDRADKKLKFGSCQLLLDGILSTLADRRAVRLVT